MKTKWTSGILIFMAVFLLFFVGCEQPADSGGTSEDTIQVPFDNFTTKSVSVTNNTGERLIAFKGEISSDTLISGVPANANNHGLKKDPQLFSATGDFALIFITEARYNANKVDLSVLKNVPFARLYAFYNASGINKVYEISSKAGGSAKLILNNSSAYNVEIRMNDHNGEILGYVPADTTNTVLSVVPGSYTLYPVFKKYIASDNEIYSITPVFKSGENTGKPYYMTATISDSFTWNVGAIYDNINFNFSAGGFYLTVNNQSETGIQLLNGAEIYLTSTGLSLINSNKQETYFIPFEQHPDGTYPASLNFALLKIGSRIHSQSIPAQDFENNKKYTITVTGENVSNLTLGAIVDNGVIPF